MTAVLIALVIMFAAACGAVALVGWRFVDRQHERAKKELEIRERQVALEERRAPKLEPPPPSEFPPHLLAVVSNESEEWAREDGLQLIAEAYVESGGDWDRAGGYLSMRYASQKGSRLPKELLQ